MYLFRKKRLAVVVPLLLTACAGGSFESSTVVKDDDPVVAKNQKESTPLVDNSVAHNPKEQTTEEQAQTDFYGSKPHLGYRLAITRRNQAHYKVENGEVVDLGIDSDGKRQEAEINLPLDANGIQGITDEQYKGRKNSPFKYVDFGIHSDSYAPVESQGEPKRATVFRQGPTGEIYYKGENTAKALPVGGEFNYEGEWDYLADVKRDRKKQSSGSFYAYEKEDFSPTSDKEDVKRPGGHSAKFKVNFGTKTLEGSLSSIPRLSSDAAKERYKLRADIKGNRFQGSATAVNKNDLYLYADAKNLEGGFYGDNAEELAGSFLTDDKSAFVVFGAKREESDNIQLDTKMDTWRVNVDDKEDYVKLNLNNFLNVNKLLVDGHEIDLLRSTKGLTETRELKTDDGTISVTLCCSNLDYTKFGVINHKSKRHQPLEEEEIVEEEFVEEDEENGDVVVAERESESDEEVDLDAENSNEETAGDNPHFKPVDELRYTPFGKSLFIQGQRTPVKEIPQAGKFDYEGTWQGYFGADKAPTIAISPENKSKASFSADFSEKKLTGNLFHNSDSNPMVIIEATIEGSGFRGTAKTGKFDIALDAGNILSGKTIRFETPTEGGFYGPNAAELGGAFYAQDPKAAGVYGAKKVEKK